MNEYISCYTVWFKARVMLLPAAAILKSIMPAVACTPQTVSEPRTVNRAAAFAPGDCWAMTICGGVTVPREDSQRESE